jgi:hypothetical protein
VFSTAESPGIATTDPGREHGDFSPELFIHSSSFFYPVLFNLASLSAGRMVISGGAMPGSLRPGTIINPKLP